MTITEYQNYIQQSQRNHLLVEGKDDRWVFLVFFRELFGSNSRETINLDIDSAEDLLISDEQLQIGNREKIEEICTNITLSTYADRFVGFVDREFRSFSWNGEVLDGLDVHNVIGRLVWSRGHSIENYFFDFYTLGEPLRDLSNTERFDEALTLFQNCFDSVLRLASALSLVGYELRDLTRIKGSIDWEIFEIDSPNVRLVFEEWKKVLKKLHYSAEVVQKIINAFQKWLPIVDSTHPTVIRWICHGHIGLTFIWEIYKRCIFQVYADQNRAHKEARNALMARERLRFNLCAGAWVRSILNGNPDYPREIIELFDWG